MQFTDCLLFFLVTQNQPELRIIALIATAAWDGLGVTACAGILFAAIGAFVEIANGPSFAAQAFATCALLVEQPSQLIYRITSHSSFVDGDRIVAMMSMAAWRSIHPVSEMNELMCYRNLNWFWLHIRLYENQVPVNSCVRLHVMVSIRTRACLCRSMLLRTYGIMWMRADSNSNRVPWCWAAFPSSAYIHDDPGW